MEKLIDFARARAADNVFVCLETDPVPFGKESICIDINTYSKITATTGICRAARIRLKIPEELFMICICSRGYAANPNTINGFDARDFLSIWDFIGASCITLDVVSASILDSARDGRTMEGYCSAMGLLKEKESPAGDAYDELVSSLDPATSMHRVGATELNGPFPSMMLLQKSCTAYAQTKEIRDILRQNF